jgi:hypothetical protein
MKNTSHTVFLSYARPDAEKAKGVYEFLRSRGFEPWLDTERLKPGQTWRAEIERAIRSSGAFISLVSPASVDRGGVLSGEMKLALDLRAERLDHPGFLIPLRLEPCPLPKELDPIQALDWFAPGAPDRLADALAPLLQRRPSLPWRWMALAGAVVAIAVVVAVWLSGSDRSGAYETFMRTRRGSPSPAPVDAPPQLGLTLWRVNADASAGSPEGCSQLRFSRQPLSDSVHTGDRLRLDVQSSVPGYVYIVSQEEDAGGKAGAALLLFPVTSINGGQNRVEPGVALMIPPASGICNTLQLTHAGEAEKVVVFFSVAPIDELPASEQPRPIASEVLRRIEARAESNSQVSYPSSPRRAEVVELPDSESRDLGYSAAGPDAVFTYRKKSGKIYAARFTLKTSP